MTDTIEFMLSDYQNCKAARMEGSFIHRFDPAKKITKIECIINKTESKILKMNFFNNQELLV